MTGRISLKIVLLAAALAALTVPVAYAQGQGQGQGNQGQGSAGGNPGNPGGGAGSTGNPGGNGSGPPGSPATSQGNAVRPSDAEFALEAVRSNRALPLADILATARQAAAGEVIDARLVTVRGFLIYEVTFLTPDGQVNRTYYYARSGRKVGSD